LSYEPADDGSPSGVQSISVLKSLCRDRTTRIVQDLTIRGRIVANDSDGEFYKELVVEDETGGIVVAIDGERLYRRYRLFDCVTIACQGLALGSEGGTLLLGTFPTGGYVVDRIPASDAQRYLCVTAESVRPTPATLRIDALAPRHISRYVRFDGVRFVESGRTYCDFDAAGEPQTTDRTIADEAGRQLVVRTDRRCAYARKSLPDGTGSLCGIVEYFNGTYRLRITNHEIFFER